MIGTSSEEVDTKKKPLRALFEGSAPRYLVAAIVVLVTARVLVGGLGWWDLALVGLLVVIQPFVEWIAHVHVLHARPRTLWALRVDPGADHRAHHEHPRDLTILFFPLTDLIGGQVAFALVFAVVFRSLPLVLTGVATVTVLSLYYEWIPDRVLRTFPDKADAPTSPTAQNLMGDSA